MKERQERLDNPYDICAWRPITECKDCVIAGRLICRYSSRDLVRFVGLFFCFLIPALVGMMFSGYAWYVLGWVGLAIVFFGFWEIRILCSHCPFYAERGFTLHCIANYGCPKFWKYHPEPISSSEKIQLVVGFALIFGYPFPFLVLGEQLILLSLAVGGLAVLLWTVLRYTCAKCVNFSCFLNRVPKRVVDEYLKRNPVMRKAWEESGWQIGGQVQNGLG